MIMRHARVTNKVVGGLTFVRLHRYIPIHLLLDLLDVLMFTFYRATQLC